MADLSEDKRIERDRLRFMKNKKAANFALLAIVFDVLFFISIYSSNVGTYYYNLLMGVSVVYNLIFMLTAFLVSEGSKNYLIQYSYVIAAAGVLQLVRIFIFPMQAHSTMIEINNQTVQVMHTAQFVRCVIYLVLSALCCFASAAVGIIKCRQLAEHKATLVETTNSEITS